MDEPTTKTRDVVEQKNCGKLAFCRPVFISSTILKTSFGATHFLHYFSNVIDASHPHDIIITEYNQVDKRHLRTSS